MAEIHQNYAPTTTAGAVSPSNPGSSSQLGQAVPNSSIESPDNSSGTNAPVVANQGQPLTITTDATGKTLTIKGTLSVLPGTSFTVNNPA